VQNGQIILGAKLLNLHAVKLSEKFYSVT